MRFLELVPIETLKALHIENFPERIPDDFRGSRVELADRYGNIVNSILEASGVFIVKNDRHFLYLGDFRENPLFKEYGLGAGLTEVIQVEEGTIIRFYDSNFELGFIGLE